jgi:hypothetical protein
MLPSTTSHLHRLLVVALTAVVLIAATGCASDDDSPAAPPATTAAPAAPQAADAAALDPSDTATLNSIRQTVARYCAGHKATAGELTGAVATLEALYQVDPDARQPDGRTVEQAAVALERRLRACGAHKAAKRLAKLTG